MYSRATGPRSIGGVLDEAVRLYRASFRSAFPFIAGLALLSVIPSVYLGLSGLYGAAGTLPLRALAALFLSPRALLIMLVFWLVQLVLYAGLTLSLEVVIQGRSIAPGDALRAGLARLPRMMGASLLLAIVLFVGFLCLIIPGIYLLGIFQLVLLAVIVEDAGVTQSFGISRRLVRGHWWRSATVTTVAVIILIVIGVLAQLIAAVLAVVLRPTFTALFTLTQIMQALVNLIRVGWFPCVLLALYHDLKLRHEGEDLALRVDALAAR